MTDDQSISIGELSRQVRDVLIRFQGISQQLQEQFINKTVLELTLTPYKQAHDNLEKTVAALESGKAEITELKALTERVGQLEDDKKWLIRLVIGFVILAILGAMVFVGGKSP